MDIAITTAGIEAPIASIGFYPGQIVYAKDHKTNKIIKDRPLLVIGYSGQDPIFSFMDDFQKVNGVHLFAGPEIDTKYSTRKDFAFLYSVSNLITESEFYSDKREEKKINDQNMIDNLNKLGLSIGQVVYMPSLKELEGQKLVVVGHDGNYPILSHYDVNPVLLLPTYYSVKKENIHSNASSYEHNFRASPEAIIVTKMQKDTPDIASDAQTVLLLKENGLHYGQFVYALKDVYPDLADVKLVVAGHDGKDPIFFRYDGKPLYIPSHIKRHMHTFYQEKYAISHSLPVHAVISSGEYEYRKHKEEILRKEEDKRRYQFSELLQSFSGKASAQVGTKAAKNPVETPFKSNLKSAGYRIVAKQTIKLTHGVLTNYLRKKGTPGSNLSALATLLSSEYGEALTSLTIGVALQYKRDADVKYNGERIQGKNGVYTPMFLPENHLSHLAKEFRVAGLTTAANEIIETIFKAALEVLTTEETRIRVATEEESPYSLEEEIMEEQHQSRVS